MNFLTVAIAPPASALAAWAAESREMLGITDDAGRIEWCNPSWERVFGFGAGGELLSLAPLDWAAGRPRALLRAGLREGRMPAGAVCCRTLDGHALDCEVRVSLQGRRRAWTFVGSDGAGRAALRTEPDAEARRLADLLDVAQSFGGLGVWEHDLRTGIARWDRRTYGFFGLDPDAEPATPQIALQRIHPDDRSELYADSTRRAGRYGERFRVLLPDASVRWVRSAWEVRNDASGRPAQAIGTMVDDTLTQQLLRSRDDATVHLRLMTDMADLAIWRHDFGTDRIHYNEQGYKVLEVEPRPGGLTVDEARAYIHPDDVPTVAATAAQALRTGEPTDAQMRHRRRDGTWRDLLVRRVLERGEDGTPRGFAGVALDISAQVRQSRRAERLTLRLEAAARGARMGLWAAGADGEPTEWNAEMHALFDRIEPGTPPSLASWLELGVHPADRARLEPLLRRYIAHPRGSREAEFRTLRRDGQARWIVVRADADRRSDETRFAGIAMDVTERHEALTALHAAGARSALIARHAGIGTWEVGADGLRQVWDEPMWRLRGLVPGAVPPDREGRLALLHPDDREQMLDNHPEDIVSPLPTAHEFRVLHPDGRYRWLSSRSLPLIDQGRVVGRIGVNWDVTEARDAASARQQAALVERESRAKSVFLARMSHELRTPMNAVLGFTNLLEREARLDRAAARATTLGRIRTAGEHLLTLIDDALDWSRLGAGTVRLEAMPVPVERAFDEALSMVDELAGEHGVRLERGRLEGTVQADPTRLRQVLLNLLTNAIKYNRPGGKVTVDARSADGSGAERPENGPVPALWLRVADAGRGIPPEQLSQLFEPFHRLGTEGGDVQGSGIGLTIVKSLVEGMGGRIEVQSTFGRGTVVAIRLPAAAAGFDDSAFEHGTLSLTTPQRVPPDTAAATAADPSRPAGRLLYIEDNAVNTLLIEELVRFRPRLSLRTAPDGSSGVAEAIRWAPALALIDMQLPDFDGFEVLRRLRAEPSTRDLRCIALSANVMPDDVQRALDAGFDDYWTKPVRFEPFLAALDRFFPSD